MTAVEAYDVDHPDAPVGAVEVVQFEGFPKIPRLFRDMVVTEKIDGTNGCIVITPYGVYAQSRNRLLKPGKSTDNFGFAAWVYENADALREILGEGRHFGEWYGHGIQRGYGLDHKRFALFNTARWGKFDMRAMLDARDQPGLELDVVPVLSLWTFNTLRVEEVLEDLRFAGSRIAPGFLEPEGIIVYHAAARQLFKALLESDDKPKGPPTS